MSSRRTTRPVVPLGRWVLLCCLAASAAAIDADLVGDFCAARRDPCCRGRFDDCSVPILGTLCYCDDFCERPGNGDCCPDYPRVCKGVIEPPPAAVVNLNCNVNGVQYYEGQTVTVDCNRCTCQKVSEREARLQCENRVCINRPELIRQINSGNFGWQASNYSFFQGKLLDDGIRYRLGTHQPDRPTAEMNELHLKKREQLPEEFDARIRWSGLVHGVRDQGDCASSWAFSTAAVASDRLSIQSRGLDKVELSPQDLMSCLNGGRRVVCQGGHPDRGWRFLLTYGGVSEECYPYEGGYGNASSTCRIPRRRDPMEDARCPTGRTEQKHFSTPPYRVPANEDDIMQEIYANGPVQALILVKEDFFLYRSGVYKHTRISETLPPEFRRSGWHSVRILGWGVDRSQYRPIKYWLCANSWGHGWGENGYFRIVRGEDESQIESFVLAVWGRSYASYYRQQAAQQREREYEGYAESYPGYPGYPPNDLS
ncbi:putative peptidase C1-like protein F26E4.3 [Rhipicephalus microplus]|uniref:putative peptidase C1-like protein F26E4.3 n=1 Tax=Rhipicephalus microplus TaxID=6941 RepID=UPI003F6B928B